MVNERRMLEMKSTKETKNTERKESIRIFPNSTAEEFETEEELREYLSNELPTRKPQGKYNFHKFRSVKNISAGTVALFRFQDRIVGFATVAERPVLTSPGSYYEGHMIIETSSIRLLSKNLSIKRLEEIINHEKSLHFKNNYKTGRGYTELPQKYNKSIMAELNRLSGNDDAYFNETELDDRVAGENLDEIKKRLMEYDSPKSKEYYGKVISRDELIISELKRIRNYSCQLCGLGIKTKSGRPYVEGAHIVPKSKKGSEAPWNILILCPNHHKEFDLGDREDIEKTKDSYSFHLNGKEYVVNLGIV